MLAELEKKRWSDVGKVEERVLGRAQSSVAPK